MNSTGINLHFVIVGEARENLGDSVIQIPSPPSAQFIPAVGDFVSVPGLESFTLGVVAREIKFPEDNLDVTCYLDTVAHNPPAPDLKRVK